jgi:hypothetical protein
LYIHISSSRSLQLDLPVNLRRPFVLTLFVHSQHAQNCRLQPTPTLQQDVYQRPPRADSRYVPRQPYPKTPSRKGLSTTNSHHPVNATQAIPWDSADCNVPTPQYQLFIRLDEEDNKKFKAFILDERGVIRMEAPADATVEGAMERMLRATARLLQDRYRGKEWLPYPEEEMVWLSDESGLVALQRYRR